VVDGNIGTMTSSDAITWTSRRQPTNQPWSRTTYGNGVYTASAYGGTFTNAMWSGSQFSNSIPENNILQGGRTLQGTLQGGDSYSGVNTIGNNLSLQGGAGRGTGIGGSITLDTASAGSSGSILNSVSTKMTVDSKGNTYGTAGTTNMSDGFIYVPSAAGPPSGTPSITSGNLPMYIDSSANKLYFYVGGWRQASSLP
jgi:hypothetical protein